jgi:hypothetical protein
MLSHDVFCALPLKSVFEDEVVLISLEEFVVGKLKPICHFDFAVGPDQVEVKSLSVLMFHFAGQVRV